eukprot:6658284-Prymnesium_polylepis.1
MGKLRAGTGQFRAPCNAPPATPAAGAVLRRERCCGGVARRDGAAGAVLRRRRCGVWSLAAWARGRCAGESKWVWMGAPVRRIALSAGSALTRARGATASFAVARSPGPRAAQTS